MFEQTGIDSAFAGFDLSAELLSVVPAGEEELSVVVVVVRLKFGHPQKLPSATLRDALDLVGKAGQYLTLLVKRLRWK